MIRIQINPAACIGKPVVTGIRTPVQTILSYMSAGDDFDDVLQAHPQLGREDVLHRGRLRAL